MAKVCNKLISGLIIFFCCSLEGVPVVLVHEVSLEGVPVVLVHEVSSLLQASTLSSCWDSRGCLVNSVFIILSSSSLEGVSVVVVMHTDPSSSSSNRAFKEDRYCRDISYARRFVL